MATSDQSDEDSISVTSTVDEGFTSDQEFVVERILAERQQDGAPYYLIYWQGYPEEDSTWEPEGNIQDDAILDVWRARKARELSGLEEPYDLARFEALVQKRQREKAERHRRRREKRIRLGLPVSDSEFEADEDEEEEDEDDNSEPVALDDSTDEAEEVYEKPMDGGAVKAKETLEKVPRVNIRKATFTKRPAKNEESRARESPLFSGSPDETLDDLIKNAKLRAQKPVKESHVSGSNDTRATSKTTTKQNLSAENSSRPLSSTTQVKQRQPSSLETPSARFKKTFQSTEKGSSTKTDKKTASNVVPPAKDSGAAQQAQLPRRDKPVRGGRVATRGGAAFSNVFVGRGKSRPVKKNLVESAADPAKPKAHFKNFHLLRKAELYGRALADSAPDLSAVPGGLFVPSNPVDYSTLRPAIRKNSSPASNQQLEEPSKQQDSSSSNTVIETHPSESSREKPGGPPQVHEKQDEPALHFASPELARRLRPWQMVCYYWASFNGCNKGIDCRYKHDFDGNPPIAPPVVATPCKFWSKTGKCSNGDRCKWLHAVETDRPPQPGTTPMDVRIKSAMEIRAEPTEQSRQNTREDPRREIQFEMREPKRMDSKEQPNSTTSELVKPNKSVRFTINHTTDLTDGSKSPSFTTTKPKSILQKKRSHEPKRSKTMSIQDYRRKSSLKAAEIRVKKVRFGATSEEVAELDFGDFDKISEELWAKSFAHTDGLDFLRACTALDFQVLMTPVQGRIYWHGVIISANSASSAITERVAQQLQLGSAGLLCIAPELMILAYPLRWEDWRFLGGPTDIPADARLGYMIFEGRQVLRELTMKLSNSNRIPALPSGGLRYKKALIRATYGLQIQTLLASPPKGSNPFNFFLIFPSTAKPLEEFLASWLRSNREDCNVYNNSTEGAWMGFVNDINIKSGVVLIHESALSAIDEFPSLGKLLFTQRHISFWSVSDSIFRYTMYRQLAFDDELFGKVSVTRLFPLGGAVFITPSFLMAEPEKANKFFKWFRSKIKITLGKWKLVCCYNLRDYLFELAIEKAIERDEFYEIHKDKPAKDALAIKEGLSYQSCEARFMAHQEFVKLLAADADDAYDEDNPKEETSPVVYADPFIDPDDEKALATWFAAWAMTRVDQFRRFFILGT
ncbi:hypothetical protein F5884DRAFT_711783, partial [Xylogone sp. PMI_703]